MEKNIRALEQIADELRQERDSLADKVREGGKQSQEGFEKVMRAIHYMHSFLFTIPDKIHRITQELKKK